MNKLTLLLLLLLLVLVPSSSLGQSFFTDRAVGVDPFSRALIPISYGQVRVCQSGAVGSPCTPVAPITDAAGNPLSIIGGNFGQLTTDVVGRFTFGCSAGNYLVQVAASSSNTPALSYMATCSGGGGVDLNSIQTITGAKTFTPPSVFTNTADNCGLQSMLNGANMTMFSSSGAGFYTQDAVCGGIIIPLGSTVSQADGVTGIVENHSNGPVVTNGTASMGGYFQTHNFGSNTVTWGVNTVGWLMSGANNSNLQNETDFDLAAGVTGATIYGWSIQNPVFDAVPAYAAGVYVGKPGCTTPNFVTYPSTGCPQLSHAYATNDGAAPVGLSLGPRGTVNGSDSQAIQMTGIDAGGVHRTATVTADLNGNIYINPVSTTNFSSGAASVDSTGKGTFTALTGTSLSMPNLLVSATAPTIATHFNTSGDSISANNGTAAFTVTVGTGVATSTGVIGLPTATTGWNCFVSNRTRAAHVQQTASSTTSATLTNFGTTFAATNWTNSDVLQVSCFAY